MNNILKEGRTILQITPQRWLNLTKNVSDELLSLSPGPNEWSAQDCLQHLVDTERWVFPIRVKALLANKDFPTFDPDSQGTLTTPRLTPAELAAEFTALRQESLAMFAQLTETDLDLQTPHVVLGQTQATMNELLHEWAAHDLNHTVQAERALMQPFIQGSGPWQFFFEDHFFSSPVPA